MKTGRKLKLTPDQVKQIQERNFLYMRLRIEAAKLAAFWRSDGPGFGLGYAACVSSTVMASPSSATMHSRTLSSV